MCFLGDAHAGASCRVQLGDPPRPSSAAEVGLVARRSSAEALNFSCGGLDAYGPSGARSILGGWQARLLPSVTR